MLLVMLEHINIEIVMIAKCLQKSKNDKEYVEF